MQDPYGARRPTDEPITLNLRFNRPQNPSEVHFVLTKDGEDAVRYAMNLVKDEDNEFTYSLTSR